MIGTVAKTTSWGMPYAGDVAVEFERGDVEAFGRLVVYGDFVTRYVAHIRGRRELVFVDGNKQTADDLKVCRAWAKRTASVRMTREIGFAVVLTNDLDLAPRFVVGGRVRVRPRAAFRLDWHCKPGDEGEILRVGQRITVRFANGCEYGIKRSDLEVI